jgi:hypothetical protein
MNVKIISTFTFEYLREFSYNFEMAPMEYSGAWGKLIHENNLKSKISCQTPFKYAITPLLYCTVLYCTVPYCTVLYCTVLCCIPIIHTVRINNFLLASRFCNWLMVTCLACEVY